MQPVGSFNLYRGVSVLNLYSRYTNRSSQNEERRSDLIAAAGPTIDRKH